MVFEGDIAIIWHEARSTKLKPICINTVSLIVIFYLLYSLRK